MFSAVLLSVLSSLARAQAQSIVSAAAWTDTSGNPIQAHGAGILKVSCLAIFTAWKALISGIHRSETRSTGSAKTKQQTARSFQRCLATR